MMCFTNWNRFTDLNRLSKMSSLERCLVREDLYTRKYIQYDSTSMFCASSIGTYNAASTYIHYTRVEYGLDDPDNPEASFIWKLAS